MGSLNKALNLYKEIHQDNPENIECLKFLVQISKEMQMPYEKFAEKLSLLEREQEANQEPQFYDQYENENYVEDDQYRGGEGGGY